MFNVLTIPVISFVTLSFFACNKKNEDVTTAVNKSGAVETAVQILPVDSARQELVTMHKVWVKNNVFKILEYRDTIPALGYQAEVENESGGSENKRVQKEYEIYITVK